MGQGGATRTTRSRIQPETATKGLIHKKRKKKKKEVDSNNGVTPDQKQETPSLF